MTELTVRGSLAQVARQRGQSLAEVLLGARFVAVVDVSSSMETPDSRGGRRRIDVAREELAALQAEHPGEIAVVAFSAHARWVPGGVPPEPEANTALAPALAFARQVDDPGLAFFVISDGQPDSPPDALREAAAFAGRVSAIYVGPEDDPQARTFMADLARTGRGAAATAARAAGLADAVRPLLGPPTPAGTRP